MTGKYTYEKLVSELGIQKADRLAYIDFTLRFKGTLSRKELSTFFGLKEATASSAISDYKTLRNENVDYNRSIGKNEIMHSTFEALLEIEAETALEMLANGFNKNKFKSEPLISYERVGDLPKKLDPEIIAKVTRAINGKTGIECIYLSASSSNHSQRLLYPTAIFYDGISWMFRAYHQHQNPEKSAYKCFNFSRLASVTERPDNPADHNETLEGDSDWNTIAPVILALHPHLSEEERAALSYEYGFDNGTDQIVVNTRAPLLYYLVSHWKIDVRQDVLSIEKPKDNKHINNYSFYIKNRDTLQHYHCMEHVFNV